MTITAYELLLYGGAVFILFISPGPVWAALIARGLSGGFHSAWPLALGVVLGDAVWPLLAIYGVAYLVSLYADFLLILRYVAVVMLVGMGVLMIWRAGREIQADSRLTAPGMWAGFTAGVLISLSNPKAVLFYMGMLPGFFEITRLTGWDIGSIVVVSILVPLMGNVVLAGFFGQLRSVLASPLAIKRINIGSGIALILVGLIIGVI